MTGAFARTSGVTLPSPLGGEDAADLAQQCAQQEPGGARRQQIDPERRDDGVRAQNCQVPRKLLPDDDDNVVMLFPDPSVERKR